MVEHRPETRSQGSAPPGTPAGVEPPARPARGAGSLTIVGLGPGPAAYLTSEAREVLAQASAVWLRTTRHPAVAALPPHLAGHSFDDLLAKPPSSTVYRRIARRLIDQARQSGGVVYAVPGDPLVGDASVRHVLAAARAAGVAVRIVAGLSFVEPVCATLGLDPLADGLQLLDAAALVAAYKPVPRRPDRDDRRRWAWLLQRAQPPFVPTRPLLVAHVAGGALARRLRPLLLERYPAEHRIILVGTPSAPGAAPARELPLRQLGRATIDDFGTTLYVPPLAALDAASELTGLRAVVARLRAPGGCPWDREQTHESLKQYLVEETYEVLEALESHEPHKLAEELGDVLLQVVLHAQLAAEEGAFALEDVLRAITTKLIRRHPHVFGSVSVADATEVVRRWEQLKQREAATAERSLLDSVPRHLPALAYAQAIQRKVARYGFDWPTMDGVLEKVAEEAAELRHAPDEDARRREAGDLLFAIVNALRWLKIDAEEALRQANRRFGRRFHRMEELAAQRGLELSRLGLADLDALWEEAKAAEHTR